MPWINARRKRVSILLTRLLLINYFAAWPVLRAGSGNKSPEIVSVSSVGSQGTINRPAETSFLSNP